MKRLKMMLFLGLCLLGLSACGGGQKVFYWERPNTGAVWFARDHNYCIGEADFWPFEWPGLPWGWGAPPELNLRFDNDSDHGVWAQFVPMPGAQPLYVNTPVGDWSVSYDQYEACMEERDYVQRKPATQNRQVFYQ